MAVKNTLYGGTDWTSEELKSIDLNDTLNATFNNVIPMIKNYGGFDMRYIDYNQTASLVNNPKGQYMTEDGLHYYIAETIGETIREYSLSKAFDISTLSYVANLNVSGEGNDPETIEFNEDGTKMFVYFGAIDDIIGYNLSTAWDITSALVNGKDLNLSAGSYSFSLNYDGSKLYVINKGINEIDEYDLGTDWDLSTASLNHTLSSYTDDNAKISYDGTKLISINSSLRLMYDWDLSTAWDITTAVKTGNNYDLDTEITQSPSEIIMTAKGTKFYILTNDVYNGDVFEYNCGYFKHF